VDSISRQIPGLCDQITLFYKVNSVKARLFLNKKSARITFTMRRNQSIHGLVDGLSHIHLVIEIKIALAPHDENGGFETDNQRFVYLS